MRYAKGIGTDLRILTLLAIEKEFAQYDMPKRLKTSYRTVLRHLQPLEKTGMIIVCRKEPSEKKGKDRKIYTLTKIGFLSILGDGVPYSAIDTVAKNYAHMFPLIFGKWDFFEEKGIKDLIIQRLQAAVVAFAMKYQKEWYRIVVGPTEEEIKIRIKKVGKERAEKFFELDRKIRENLTRSVIGFWRYLHFEDSVLAVQVQEEKRVLRILAEDPDIGKYLHKEIKSFEADAREELDNVVSWREWFKKL